jgi:hypothetical protein
MEGLHGETVRLVKPIAASPRPQKWLANLEQNMRDTLLKELADCVRNILDENMTNITWLVDRLAHQGMTYCHRSLQYLVLINVFFHVLILSLLLFC